MNLTPQSDSVLVEPVAPPPQFDGLLQVIAHISSSEIPLAFSVLVGGTWISGHVVKGQEWMDLVAAHSTVFAAVNDIVAQADEESDDAASEGDSDAAGSDELEMNEYLHFSAATSYTGPGYGIPKNGAPLRVSLTSVDAWMPGLMSAG